MNPEGKTTEEIAFEGINRLSAFWSSLGAPERLAYYGIDDSKISLMAEKVTVNGKIGRFSKIGREDVEEILRVAL